MAHSPLLVAAFERGEVNDRVGSKILGDIRKNSCAGHVVLNETKRHVLRRTRIFFPTARAQIVHADEAVAFAQEQIHSVTADEPGGTGDEDIGHGFLRVAVHACRAE